MSALTIRNLDDGTKALLRVQAAQQGCSMEEQVRRILTLAVTQAEPPLKLGSHLQQRFAGLQASEIRLPARSSARRAPDFG